MTMSGYLKRKRDVARSLERLIETNGGRYKSEQQRRFMETASFACNVNRDTMRPLLPCGARITLARGESVHILPVEDELVIDGVTYAVDHAYICDADGVVRKLRVMVRWDNNEATYETLWERQ